MAGIALATLTACRGGADVGQVSPDAAASTGERVILLERVLLPENTTESFAGWGETWVYSGMLPVPGPSGDLGIVLQPSRPRANPQDMWTPGLEFIGFGRPSARISNDVGGQYLLSAFAVGRTAPGSGLSARVVTVLAGSRMPTGGFDWFAPWTMPRGVVLESWPLEPSKKPVRSVELDAGISLGARILAVGDVNRDGDEDFCLLGGQGSRDPDARGVLVSGSTLAQLSAFPIGTPLGQTLCTLGERDGVSDIFALLETRLVDVEGRVVHDSGAPFARESWCVISPGEGRVRGSGSLRHAVADAPDVHVAAWAGFTPEGHARVALLGRILGQPGRSSLRVLDVDTGAVLESRMCVDAKAGPGTFATGALPGAAGRRWIAWTLVAEGPAPRLFVAEIGALVAAVEIELPDERQRWAWNLCAMRGAGTDAGDRLAITLAVPAPDAEAADFRPVRLVDVARCLAAR